MRQSHPERYLTGGKLEDAQLRWVAPGILQAVHKNRLGLQDDAAWSMSTESIVAWLGTSLHRFHDVYVELSQAKIGQGIAGLAN